MQKLLEHAIAPLALCLAADVAAAGILTVGPAGSGAAFTEIQAAVDAAGPGDTILVAAGGYQPVRVTKPLHILGAGSDLVSVGLPCIPPACPPATSTVGLEVEGIAVNGEVLVSGVTVYGETTFADDAPVVRLKDNPGTVILHDLDVPGLHFAGPGMLIESSARVIVYSSSFTGGRSTNDEGAQSIGSTVWWNDCRLTGSSGASPPTSGGTGLLLEDSATSLARTGVQGGDAGDGGTFVFNPGGIGIASSDSLIGVVGGPGNLIVGGQDFPSFPLPPVIQPALALGGPSGSAALIAKDAKVGFVQDLSNLVIVDLVYPTLGVDRTHASPGDTITLDLAGSPGTLGLVYGSLRHGPSVGYPGINGVFVLDPVLTFFTEAVTLSPSGTATSDLSVLNQANFAGLVFLFQWIELPGPQLAVSNPALVPILP